MTDECRARILTRIGRAAGGVDLPALLGERLAPADLRSLLLEVHRRRAAALTAPAVLRRYERDRHVAPAPADPRRLAALDAFAFETARGFEPLELSPVAPLGTVSALAGLDQDAVLSTSRGTEVLSDSTNVLALESARRRRGDRDGVVRLCASHRVLRPAVHFRLFVLTSAGRARGEHGFELDELATQIGVHLALLRHVGEGPAALRVTVTALPGGPPPERIERALLAPLRAHVPAQLDPGRTRAIRYYAGVCFEIFARTPAGPERSLVDGGLVPWTQRLLADRRERLVISGIGTELMLRELAQASTK